MKKVLSLVFSLLILPQIASAQFTSVTATITDIDGQTWNNGKWTATLVNPNPQVPPTINGTPLTAAQMNLSGTMSSGGVITATMASNAVIVPGVTYWSFTICPNASASCSVVSASVSGGSQNISTTLSSGIRVVRFPASPTSYGYADAEVTPIPNPGGQYYNVTNSINRIWNGSAWTNGGSGGGGTTIPVPPGFPQQLLGFSGTQTSNTANQVPSIVPDGLAWDMNGLGGPSTPIWINNEWWVCAAGYSTGSLNSAKSFGCWHGADRKHLIPYSGNPVYTPTIYTWDADCTEGPDFYSDGSTVLMSFGGYTIAGGGCDAQGTGSIAIVSTTATNFPIGWSTTPATPTIPKPVSQNWMFRGIPIDINNTCHLYANGGDGASHGVIFEFTTNGTCVNTATTAANWTYIGNVVGHSQAWEGAVTDELEDPQVFQLPSGVWVMIYANGPVAGYAVTSAPDVNPLTTWSKLQSNPIQANGYEFWLPRIGFDASGDCFAFVNANNTPGIFYADCGGTPKYQLFFRNANTINSTHPAWVVQDDPLTDALSFFTTYPNTLPSTVSYWNNFALKFTLDKTGQFGAQSYKSLTSLTDGCATWTSNILGSTGSACGGGGGSGSLVKLESHTASSSANLDFTGTFTTSVNGNTYNKYVFEVETLVPASTPGVIYGWCSSDGGGSYDTGNNYQYSVIQTVNSVTTPTSLAPIDSLVYASPNVVISNSVTNGGWNAELQLTNPSSTVSIKHLQDIGSYYNTTNQLVTYSGTLVWNVSASKCNAIRFSSQTGFTSGTITVYGITP